MSFSPVVNETMRFLTVTKRGLWIRGESQQHIFRLLNHLIFQILAVSRQNLSLRRFPLGHRPTFFYTLASATVFSHRSR